MAHLLRHVDQRIMGLERWRRLTDLLSARIDPAPDRQISVSRGEAGESQSLVVPMTIANAVILNLAAIDDGRSLRALSGFKAFRADCGLSPVVL